MKNTISRKYLESSFSYDAYCTELSRLLKEKKVTGKNQSSELVEATKLHMHRMQRIDKSISILPEVAALLDNITSHQTWFVLTEGWCGDAAQIVPVLNAFTKVSKNIRLAILLRDENLELIDQYLTHGKSRSIPKLIVAESENMQELFHWGPRPHNLQHLMNDWVADEMTFEEMKYELHLWYARDKALSIQKEISELVRTSI